MPRSVTPSNVLSNLRQVAFQPFTSMENMLQGWFQTNVSVNVFGRNVEDKDVEEHVLNNVGSYGKQLNVILDALMVLIKRLESQPEFAKQISQPEHHAIYELKELARMADAVARAYQGKPPAPNGSEDTPARTTAPSTALEP